jgi:hypothetical protein
MLECLRPSRGFPKPKDPANLSGDEINHKKWNAKAKTPSLEALVKRSLTMCGTTRMPMYYGRIFVCFMREPRVSMRNAIIL